MTQGILTSIVLDTQGKFNVSDKKEETHTGDFDKNFFLMSESPGCGVGI